MTDRLKENLCWIGSILCFLGLAGCPPAGGGTTAVPSYSGRPVPANGGLLDVPYKLLPDSFMKRTSVPGGWLVYGTSDFAMTVDDPEHRWGKPQPEAPDVASVETRCECGGR
jgi:hypothetical protein